MWIREEDLRTHAPPAGKKTDVTDKDLFLTKVMIDVVIFVMPLVLLPIAQWTLSSCANTEKPTIASEKRNKTLFYFILVTQWAYLWNRKLK